MRENEYYCAVQDNIVYSTVVHSTVLTVLWSHVTDLIPFSSRTCFSISKKWSSGFVMSVWFIFSFGMPPGDRHTPRNGNPLTVRNLCWFSKNLRISNNNPRATCFGLILIQCLDYIWQQALDPRGIGTVQYPVLQSRKQQPSTKTHRQCTCTVPSRACTVLRYFCSKSQISS